MSDINVDIKEETIALDITETGPKGDAGATGATGAKGDPIDPADYDAKGSIVNGDKIVGFDSEASNNPVTWLFSVLKTVLAAATQTLTNKTFGDNVGVGGAPEELAGWSGTTINIKDASIANVYLLRDDGKYVNMGLASSFQFRSNQQVVFTTTAGSNQPIDFRPNDSRRLRINHDGNAGFSEDSPDSRVHVDGAITQNALSADPADPANGKSVEWTSDGTASGDDGDVLKKSTNSLGVTTMSTIHDHTP